MAEAAKTISVSISFLDSDGENVGDDSVAVDGVDFAPERGDPIQWSTADHVYSGVVWSVAHEFSASDGALERALRIVVGNTIVIES